MSLGDHLRELRRRFVISALAITAASVVGWVEYDWLFDRIMRSACARSGLAW